MKASGRRAVGVVSVGGMLALLVAGTGPASSAAGVRAAAVPGAVPLSQARFAGYSSGDTLHLGALSTKLAIPAVLPGITPTAGGTSVADVEQGFSGASAASGGLASPITGDDAGSPGTGLLVQPAQAASTNAYGVGSGLEAGLVAPADASGNQLKLAGRAESVAAPNSPAVTDSLTGSGALNLGGLLSASALTGRADSFYDTAACPLGQPLSFGLGDATGAQVLPGGTTTSLPGLGGINIPGVSTLTGLLGGLTSVLHGATASGGLISTVGSGTSVAQTDSETFLSSNGDGTYGVTTQSRQSIAPVTVNLFGLAKLTLTVSGTSPDNPLTLSATTTGEGAGAKVALSNNAIVQLSLTAAGQTVDIIPPTSLTSIVGAGGLVIPLDLQQLGATIQKEVTNLQGQVAAIPTLGPILSPLIGTLTGVAGSVTKPVTGLLDTVTAMLPKASLGYIAIGVPPRAINSDPSATTLAPPVQSGGSAASGAFDLARIHLGLSVAGFGNGPGGSLGPLTGLVGGIPGLAGLLPSGASLTGNALTIADVAVGHLEASSTLSAPITCNLKVVKSSNPTSVTAGQPFTYTIQIPDPATLADLSCSLTNVTATDVIGDNKGAPTFNVVGVSNGGTVDQSSPTKATITWSGLTYDVAPVGSPPNPPITLTITVNTPASSPAGIIQDMVAATGTASGCNGGVTGITDLGGVNGNSLTGSYTLTQPGVAALVASGAQAAPAAPQGALPHTGGTGGLWQPLGGVVVLGLGGVALALVRRSRHRLG